MTTWIAWTVEVGQRRFRMWSLPFMLMQPYLVNAVPSNKWEIKLHLLQRRCRRLRHASRRPAHKIINPEFLTHCHKKPGMLLKKVKEEFTGLSDGRLQPNNNESKTGWRSESPSLGSSCCHWCLRNCSHENTVPSNRYKWVKRRARIYQLKKSRTVKSLITKVVYRPSVNKHTEEHERNRLYVNTCFLSLEAAFRLCRTMQTCEKIL